MAVDDKSVLDVEVLLTGIIILEKVFNTPGLPVELKSQILKASAYLLDHTMINPKGLSSFKAACEKGSQTKALITHKDFIEVVVSRAPIYTKRPTCGQKEVDELILKIVKLLRKDYNNREKTLDAIEKLFVAVLKLTNQANLE